MAKRRAGLLPFTIFTGVITAGSLVVGAGAAAARPVDGMATAPPPSASATHPYRHGWVQIRGAGAGSRQEPGHSADAHAAGRAVSTANDLVYQGGISGVGVTTGKPRVYLVFYGSQWGTQGTNAAGNATFSGDPKGMACLLYTSDAADE